MADTAKTKAAGGEIKPAGTPRKLTKAAVATFLAHLAATAHVTQACDAGGFGMWAAYDRRRRDPQFAGEWRAALLAGYDRIEAALIRRALGLPDHEPVVDIDETGPAGHGELDVHLALHLLNRHRPTVERAAKDLRETAFRASRDVAEDALLAKLKAYAKKTGLGVPGDVDASAPEPLPLETGRA